MNRFGRFLLVVFSILLITAAALAQYNPDSFSAMKWRLVGPHRGGRVTTVAGVPGKPAIYYFGTPGGGVWKDDRWRSRLETNLRRCSRSFHWRLSARAFKP